MGPIDTIYYWNSLKFGDSSRVTTTAPAGSKFLNADGTQGGVITEIDLRQGEAAILMK